MNCHITNPLFETTNQPAVVPIALSGDLQSQHKRTRPSASSPYNAVGTLVEVREHDVLWGRTKTAHAHAGNAAFRRLIRQYRVEYQTTRVREEKSRVVRTIMARISSLGGRFLKSSGPNWVEADPTQTYDKVSHALRSARPAKASSGVTKPAFAVPVVSAEMTVHEATYENLFQRQKGLLETFKVAHETQQEWETLPRCFSVEASTELLKDLDKFIGNSLVPIASEKNKLDSLPRRLSVEESADLLKDLDQFLGSSMFPSSSSTIQ